MARPLFKAIQEGHQEKAHRLALAHPEWASAVRSVKAARDEKGRWHGQSVLEAVLLKGWGTLALMLLKQGAPPEDGGMLWSSPLAIAARMGQLEAVSALLEAGADPQRMVNGTTALSECFEFTPELCSHSIELIWPIVSVLWEAGARFVPPHEDNFWRQGNELLNLMDHCDNAQWLQWFERLHPLGVNINTPGYRGTTLLMLAAQSGRESVMRKVWEHTENPLHCNQNEDSAEFFYTSGPGVTGKTWAELTSHWVADNMAQALAHDLPLASSRKKPRL